MHDIFTEASAASNSDVIQNMLDRYAGGDVVLFKGQPIIWRFATEVEFAIMTSDAPSIIDLRRGSIDTSAVDLRRQERIDYRRGLLNETADTERRSQLLAEIEQLEVSGDFKGYDDRSCGDALKNLIICEINDILHAEGRIAHKFGTGTHQSGWFDAPGCGEVITDGSQEAHKIIEDHERKIEVIKGVAEKYGAEARIYGSHLNFSINIERDGELQSIQEIGTDEALALHEKAIAGISYAFVKAEPFLNACKVNGYSPEAEYYLDCNAGTHRGKGSIRSSQTHAEHRHLGFEPDIGEAIALMIGGASAALETDDEVFEQAGFKKGQVVDVPIWEDAGENYMLMRIFQASQLNRDTGELVLDDDAYTAFRTSIVREIFNGFEELKEHTRDYEYEDFMRLEKSTKKFFSNLHVKSDGSIDVDRHRQHIEENMAGLVKDHYAETLLKALSEIRFTGQTFRTIHHEGYPTKFGGPHHEQRLSDMGNDPVLASIYGREALSLRVSMVADNTQSEGLDFRHEK